MSPFSPVTGFALLMHFSSNFSLQVHQNRVLCSKFLSYLPCFIVMFVFLPMSYIPPLFLIIMFLCLFFCSSSEFFITSVNLFFVCVVMVILPHTPTFFSPLSIHLRSIHRAAIICIKT